MPSQYWNAQLEPFNRGVGNIASALIRAPMVRAQAGYLQSREAELQQLAEEAAARTGLLKTQGQRANLQLNQALALAQELQRTGAVTQDADGNTVISKEAAPVLLSGVAGMGTSGNDSANAIGNVLKALNAVPQAGLNRNKAFNLSPGSAHYDANGKLVVANPSAASGNAANLFDTVTEKYPAVPGTPADVSPASNGILGFGAHPAITNAPAIAAIPERTIIRKVPRGSILSALPDNAGAAQPTTNSAPAAAPAAGTTPPANARTFTDKTGQTFIYTGNLADPSKDQNPNNWQVAK